MTLSVEIWMEENFSKREKQSLGDIGLALIYSFAFCRLLTSTHIFRQNGDFLWL